MALFSKVSYFEQINVFEFELCPLISPPSYKHYIAFTSQLSPPDPENF